MNIYLIHVRTCGDTEIFLREARSMFHVIAMHYVENPDHDIVKVELLER